MAGEDMTAPLYVAGEGDDPRQDGGTVVPLPVDVMKKLLGDGDGADIQRSNLLDLSESMQQSFGSAGALAPPLDPLALVRLVSMSSTLPPLIDAMAVNIHGFGYRFDPIIDLDSSDAMDRIRAAMLLEAEHRAEEEAGDDEKPERIEPPTDKEVTERIDSLREQMRREKAKLEAFFSNVNRKYSFTRLSRKAQVDKESTGFFAWEIRRDGHGRVSRIEPAPSWTFRALSLGSPVEVESWVRASDISYRSITEPVRFRRFVQVYEQRKVYFKEFGDPRVMSRKTGVYYKDLKELRREEDDPQAHSATEILWSALDSSESDVYGMIRWSGCIPGVVGSREQAEVNLLFFRSKAIPPMVVMVSGGKLAKGARERLETLIKNEIRGVENFHKILVLEAEPSGKGIGGAGGLGTQDKVKIELRPLTEHIFKDALWQGYQENNRKELGQSFRLPPMMRGDTERLNRATAKIAREATEQLVIGPERRDFEFDMDRTILTDMGIMLWRFKLNAPESTDAEQLVEFVKVLLDGTMSPNEARRIMSRVLGVELPPMDADWARMPLKHALAGLAVEPLPEETDDADTGGDGLEDDEKSDEEATGDDRASIVKIRVAEEQFLSLLENNDPI